MGCGCKNDVNDSVSEHTSKKTFKENLNYYLNNRNGFSVVGFVGSLLFIPIAVAMVIPILSAVIFTKFTLNKDLNLVNLIVFTKDKKSKK